MSSEFLRLVSAAALVGVIALSAFGRDHQSTSTFAIVLSLWAVVAAIQEAQKAIIERITRKEVEPGNN